MKKSIVVFIVKVLFLLIPVPVILLYYSNKNFLPLITSNISLDAKIHETQKIKNCKLELISIGSSMTLNNLNSKILTDSLKMSYYNFGAWGIQISDISYLINIYIDEYNPKYVIICSSITDFKYKDEFKLPLKVEFEVNKWLPGYFYLKNLNIFNLTKQNVDYSFLKCNTDDYANLIYDDYGGVPLDISKEKISKERWNEKFYFPSPNTEYQYSKLINLVKFLNKKSVKLIFIQSPIREAYACDESMKNKLYAHFSRCKSIIEQNKGIYLNLYNTGIYVDSLFVDQFHLSKYGSEFFTKQLIIKLNQTDVFKNNKHQIKVKEITKLRKEPEYLHLKFQPVN